MDYPLTTAQSLPRAFASAAYGPARARFKQPDLSDTLGTAAYSSASPGSALGLQSAKTELSAAHLDDIHAQTYMKHGRFVDLPLEMAAQPAAAEDPLHDCGAGFILGVSVLEGRGPPAYRSEVFSCHAPIWSGDSVLPPLPENLHRGQRSA